MSVEGVEGRAALESLAFKIAAVGVAGVAAQWMAWRTRAPAIVLLLSAGLLLGPVSGLIDPQRDFGELFKPMVAIAVAIILFEGGITLKFEEIRHTSLAVRRLVFIGAPLGAVLGALAARYGAGLDWGAAAILGGLFVVTGPTVIMPLLRQAKLGPRPSALLRWEAIVNDPIGALFAVLAFEVVMLSHGAALDDLSPGGLAFRVVFALALALVGGYALARFVVWLFNAGLAPEYLKVPILLAAVLAGYEVSQLALEESGLLTVTVMGVAIANSKLASLTEIKRFKETVTILLVSGVFILLTATLDAQTFALMDWRVAVFVALMLFVVRPVTIFAATMGAGLSFNERLLVAWIAPRGVVAVAVAGFFGAALIEAGVPGGREMTAIAFAMVFATVLLHGFSLSPLAGALGLASARQAGVLMIGGGPFTLQLAEQLKAADYPVMIADGNWLTLSRARQAGVPVFYGEILSETAEHSIDFNPYGVVIAATANDAYNTLVCADFGPEIGRANVFQLSPSTDHSTERREVSHTLMGRRAFDEELSGWALRGRMAAGWTVKTATLSEQFGLADALEKNSGPSGSAAPLILLRASGALLVVEAGRQVQAKPQDRLVLLTPPDAKAQSSDLASG